MCYTIRCFALALLTSLIVLLSQRSSTAAGEKIGADERLFKEAGLATDDASLIALLHRHCPSDEDLQSVKSLVRQLGSEQFEQREQASKKLIAIGTGAFPDLVRAARDPDKEVAARAMACIQEIDRDSETELVLAAVRLLVGRSAGGAAEALLRYLPSAPDEDLEEEIAYGLDRLAEERNDARSKLAESLSDVLPARRAIAGCIVARLGTPAQRKATRKLLVDPDAMVRLRTAQGLLAAKDKSGIPVLVGLLNEGSTELAWQAEELLHWVARDQAPNENVGDGRWESRVRCRKAWERWWQTWGMALELAKLDTRYSPPGLVLWRGWDFQGGETLTSVYLTGCDARLRWKLLNTGCCDRPQLLPGGRILAAELIPGEGSREFRIAERDLQGRLLWEHRLGLPPSSCQRLPNGSTFFERQGWVFVELAPNGKESSVIHLKQPRGLVSRRVCKLRNGRFFYSAAVGDQPPILGEFDSQSRKIIRHVPVPNKGVIDDRLAASQPQDLPPLEDKLHSPAALWVMLGVARLRNGNTLVDRGPFNPHMVELDQAGKIVCEIYPPESLVRSLFRGRSGSLGAWILDLVLTITRGRAIGPREEKGQPSFPLCLRLVGLGFHTPRPATEDPTSLASRIKDLKSKDVRVRWRATRYLEQFDPKPSGAVPALLEALADPDRMVRRSALNALRGFKDVATPYLVEARKHKHPNVRAGVLELFAYTKMNARTHDSYCLEAIKDSSPQVRVIAALMLGRDEKRDLAIAALAEALKDKARFEDWSVGQAALASLRLLGPKAKAAVPALLTALRDKDPEYRISAANALGAISPTDQDVVSGLLQALRDKNPFVRRTVAEALAHPGNARVVVPALTDLLKSPEIEQSRNARSHHADMISALGKIGPGASAAVPLILEMLRKVRYKEGRYQDSDDYTLRASAILALGKIGPAGKAAIPALREIADDQHSRLDEAAAEALKLIERRD